MILPRIYNIQNRVEEDKASVLRAVGVHWTPSHAPVGEHGLHYHVPRATSSTCTKAVHKKVYRCEGCCKQPTVDPGKPFAVTFQAKMHREPPKTAFFQHMSPILNACQRFGHLELLVRDWVNYEVTSQWRHCIGALSLCSQDGFNIGECKVGHSTCHSAFGRCSVFRPRAKGTDAGTSG